MTRVCLCGKKMKQQFIGLQHCKCGVCWHKKMGYFERTSNMVLKLQRIKKGSKTVQTVI